MRPGRALFPLLLSVLLLVGCVATTKQVESLDARITVLNSRMDRVENRLGKLEKRVEQLSEAEKSDTAALRSDLADTNVALKQLEDDSRYLKGGIEQAEKGVSDLGDRMDQIETRLTALEQSIKGIQAKKPKKAINPQSLYDTALQLFRSGQYLDSLDAFRKFLKEFPDHTLAGNAQYWIGECLYAMGKKKEAILAFDKVVKGYPESPKIPSALLKEGLTFLSLGNRAVAKILLKRVVNDYPDTDQAKIAARELKALVKKERPRPKVKPKLKQKPHPKH